MTRPIPNYLFHIPHMGDIIDYNKLVRKMNTKNPPEVVDVIDATSNPRKRLGRMPASFAIIKFR
jgi:hypothetical protein